jgi:hypothetical protein
MWGEGWVKRGACGGGMGVCSGTADTGARGGAAFARGASQVQSRTLRDASPNASGVAALVGARARWVLARLAWSVGPPAVDGRPHPGQRSTFTWAGHARRTAIHWHGPSTSLTQASSPSGVRVRLAAAGERKPVDCQHAKEGTAKRGTLGAHHNCARAHSGLAPELLAVRAMGVRGRSHVRSDRARPAYDMQALPRTGHYRGEAPPWHVLRDYP